MPKSYVRYWFDTELKTEIEQIAAKMDKSANWLAEKLLRAGLHDLKIEAELARKQKK